MPTYDYDGYANGTDLGSTTDCTREVGNVGSLTCDTDGHVNFAVATPNSLYTYNSGQVTHEFIVTLQSTGGGNFFHCCIAVADINNMFAARVTSGNVVEFYVYNAGAQTLLGSVASGTRTVGVDTLGLRRVGTTISLLWKGSVVASATNSSHAAATKVGYFGRSSTGTDVLTAATVTPIFAQNITVVNGGNPVKLGATVSITVTGFTKAITKGSLDGVALASPSATSITIPALVDGQQIPRVGAERTLFLSSADDTETATINIPVANPDTPIVLNSVVLESGFNTGESNSVVYGFSPAAEINDIIFFDPTKGEVFPNAGYEGSYSGEQLFWHHDISTKIVYSCILITGADGEIISIRRRARLSKFLRSYLTKNINQGVL